ncbi:hypothetical protein K7H91_12305 [Martelella mediterranea]|uniref:hypothetical protein n=1 Tax=Martelella mediterranea TaxID=293089 RepID=UPI001E35FB6A|nr:hypothetical protein [Martelella mediterranea]MCD1634555.1 hypothetical protein [Martelella mediterranea]
MPKKPAVFDAANTRLMDSTARLIKTAQSIATSPDIDSETRKTALKVMSGYLNVMALVLEETSE